jgi:hypothetical protein
MVRKKRFLFEIEAVVAIEVAGRPAGLSHDVKSGAGDRSCGEFGCHRHLVLSEFVAAAAGCRDRFMTY